MSIFHKKIKKKINELEELYATTKSKLMHEQDYCDQLNNLLTQKDKDIADLTLNLTKEKERSKRLNHEAQEYYNAIIQLKQQLAEKEKEIEESDDEWREICDGKLETINRLIEEKHEFQQSQNQTAIAELNNILDTFTFFVNEEKESIVSTDKNGNLSLLEYIENRIDALKGDTKC